VPITSQVRFARNSSREDMAPDFTAVTTAGEIPTEPCCGSQLQGEVVISKPRGKDQHLPLNARCRTRIQQRYDPTLRRRQPCLAADHRVFQQAPARVRYSARSKAAWPTTFFVGRDGKVRSIHTGFAASASGAFHTQLRQEFTGTVEHLLAE
jgi:hypothetical protein